MHSHSPASVHPRFTLVELLVVIAIISILAGMLLPALQRARRQAQIATCASNLKQQALAVQMYANDHDGCAPMRTGYTDPDNTASAVRWPSRLAPYLGVTGTVRSNSCEVPGSNNLLIPVFTCPLETVARDAPSLSATQKGFFHYSISWYLSLDPGTVDANVSDRTFTTTKRPTKRILIADNNHLRSSSTSYFIALSEKDISSATIIGFTRHNPADLSRNYSFIDGHVEPLARTAVLSRYYENTASYSSDATAKKEYFWGAYGTWQGL